MRRTRFMSVIFLVLSLAFLGAEEFRWGLQAFLLHLRGDEDLLDRPWLAGISHFRDWLTGISAQRLRAWAQDGNPEEIAFAALYPVGMDPEEVFRLAEQAVAKDPNLTWIYAPVLFTAWVRRIDFADRRVAERLERWVASLEASDPQNSVPWLLRAFLTRLGNKGWPKDPDIDIRFLATQEAWLAAMARAFEQPRYDSYARRRFDLERKVLRQRGRATPLAMATAVSSHVALWGDVQPYLRVHAKHLAQVAEQAGRLDEAIVVYRRTIAFSGRLSLGATSLIERMVAVFWEQWASQGLLGVLRKAGRTEEAALVELRLGELARSREGIQRADPIAQRVNEYWSVALLKLFGALVLLFGALTLAAVAYVNAKRVIRRDRQGRLYRLVTTAENYLPVLLFLSCAGLYLVYEPYALNFRHYVTVSRPIVSLEEFTENVLPMPTWVSKPSPEFMVTVGYLLAPLPVYPFLGYVRWALPALLIAVTVAGWAEWRVRRRQRQSAG